MKLKKGDNVIVTAGADKGKKGKIVKVLREENRVVIDGVNVKKHHTKGSSKGSGTIVEAPAPVDASNVMFYDSAAKKGVRLGKKLVGEKYVRIMKGSENEA